MINNSYYGLKKTCIIINMKHKNKKNKKNKKIKKKKEKRKKKKKRKRKKRRRDRMKETTSCMSTLCSWEDVLGFKETYSVIFET